MNKISAFAFDLDGTIYNGQLPVKGALSTINALRDLNYKIFFFTNNSAKTRQQIVDKLNQLGFGAELQNTYCTSWAMGSYLLARKLNPVYLIGSRNLKNELLKNGVKIKDASAVAAVVVGLDTGFSYAKIAKALELMRKGAKLIAANTDASYPISNNRRLPGCGAMVAAILGAASAKPDFTVGKPNTYMLKLLCQEHHLSPTEICIVGDSPQSDIKMATRLKCPSILFDPDNKYSRFLGSRIKKHQEIFLLINKKRGK